MRHLIEPMDFTEKEIRNILDLANRIAANPSLYSHVAEEKKLATLFYEPSTRTRLSFESAMLSLGGKTLGFSSAEQSSATKGETVADTVRVVSCYADIIAMRHPKEGAPLQASMYAKVPVINAGDGGHNHPTQTLIDMMTIRNRKGRLDHLKVGFCGDLKFGRTVHSLTKTLMRYEGNEFYFISPEELRIPEYLEKKLHGKNISYHECEELESALPKLDVLYMTRVQKERFFNEEDYIRLKDRYILTEEKLSLADKNMPVLHPLPRVNEIAYEVDDDPRAAYFEQVQNGVYIRMALIMALLGLEDPGKGGEVFDVKS
ncbi:MAG: aspartate carbamoyltransferase [Roseburia sp.]